jgi:hypothetical protein
MSENRKHNRTTAVWILAVVLLFGAAHFYTEYKHPDSKLVCTYVPNK